VTFGITPFKDGPFAVLKYVFHQAHHLRRCEACPKHGADGFSALDKSFSDLMVDGRLAVESGKSIDISPVKCLYPSLDKRSRLGLILVS